MMLHSHWPMRQQGKKMGMKKNDVLTGCIQKTEKRNKKQHLFRAKTVLSSLNFDWLKKGYHPFISLRMQTRTKII